MASKRVGDALVQHGAVGRDQRELQHAVGQFGLRPVEQRRHRGAAEPENFQRAADALGVVRRQPRGGRRVDRRQLGVQRGPAARRRLGLQLLRSAASARGRSSSPCSSARKYSMVPPTSSGTRPRATMSAISLSASSRNAAAE
jgi:hypothetical protein